MAEAPKQRTVLITGTSSGIGLATAARLARDPQSRYMVIATMRDPRRSAALEAAVGSALGRTLRVERLDVNCEKSVRECMEVYGESVDVLVNNAGVGAVGPLEGTAMAELQRVVDTNVMGVVRAVRAVLPHMKRRRGGHIVVISSVMGRHGLLFNEVYSASKFAVEGFCESLAMQLLHFNVAVTLVEPGPVHTALERQLLEAAEEAEFPGADEETLRYFRCGGRRHFLPAAAAPRSDEPPLRPSAGAALRRPPGGAVHSRHARPPTPPRRSAPGRYGGAALRYVRLLPAERRPRLERPLAAGRSPPAGLGRSRGLSSIGFEWRRGGGHVMVSSKSPPPKK